MFRKFEIVFRGCNANLTDGENAAADHMDTINATAVVWSNDFIVD